MQVNAEIKRLSHDSRRLAREKSELFKPATDVKLFAQLREFRVICRQS
jgi:hypothetical protein